jgi:hypothetical protein
MANRVVRAVVVGASAALGVALVGAATAIPVVLLLRVDDKTLARWSDVGQATTPIGVFFSGLAFIGIAVTLAFQQRELRNQREELGITTELHRKSSEVALRQLHTDLIKMAIADPELLEVWPGIQPGATESRKDHYCNLILNLQKVAFEAETIGVEELRGALTHLMTSSDIRSFWARARVARAVVTESDVMEDFFTREVDAAFDRGAG